MSYMTSRTKQVSLLAINLTVVLMSIFLLSSIAWAQAEPSSTKVPDPTAFKWAVIAAAASVGAGCLGAGIAVAYVGSASVAAVAEKPELSGRMLVFVGLAEGIAIYGLIISIMILGMV